MNKNYKKQLKKTFKERLMKLKNKNKEINKDKTDLKGLN